MMRFNSTDLLEKMAEIDYLVLDVDGVQTDGKLAFDAQANPIRTFCVYDGRGILDCIAAGLDIWVISHALDASAEIRCERLGITTYSATDPRPKNLILADLIENFEGDTPKLDRMAYMGDDTNDIPVLQMVGLSLAPANAHADVKKRVHYVTQAPGGYGAVREITDVWLEAKGLHAYRMSTHP